MIAAASIAKVAGACARAGDVERGMEIALDIEQFIYEMNSSTQRVKR
jgi:hypothetical protein